MYEEPSPPPLHTLYTQYCAQQCFSFLNYVFLSSRISKVTVKQISSSWLMYTGEDPFSPSCPAFFGEPPLILGWPTGVVPPHTYFCLVTTVTQQWESGSMAGIWRVSMELRYQQLHPYLLFHADWLAFLCFLLQVPHQHVSNLANDGEHLDTKYNIA